jgi:hypothetical protein
MNMHTHWVSARRETAANLAGDLETLEAARQQQLDALPTTNRCLPVRSSPSAASIRIGRVLGVEWLVAVVIAPLAAPGTIHIRRNTTRLRTG